MIACWFRHPLAPPVCYSIAFSCWLIAYQNLLGSIPYQHFTYAQMPLSMLVAQGLSNEARRRRDVPCFDYGFFAALFLPIVIVWYGAKHSGRGGRRLAAIALAIWLGPTIVGNVILNM